MPRHPGGREKLFFVVMVRIAEDQLEQLDFFCARWTRHRGTLARQLITDGLSDCLASPAAQADWREYKKLKGRAREHYLDKMAQRIRQAKDAPITASVAADEHPS